MFLKILNKIIIVESSTEFRKENYLELNIRQKIPKNSIIHGLFILLFSIFVLSSPFSISANESLDTHEDDLVIKPYNFSSEEERDKYLNDYNLNYMYNINTISTFRMMSRSSTTTAYGISPALSVTYTYTFPPGYSTGFGPQSSDYTQTSYLPKAKTSATYDPITTMMLWCIEPVDLFSGGANNGYSSVSQTIKKAYDASVVAYWGYESKKNTGNQNANLKRAFMTEKYMQEIMTGVRTINISGGVDQSEYDTFKNNMDEEIRKYNTLPSIRDNTVTLGNSAETLTDSNSSISRYKVTSNTANVGVSISGDDVTLTPNANTKNGSVTFQYDVPATYQRNPARLVHSTAKQQELLDIGLGDPKIIKIDIQATGDLEIVKESTDSSVLSNSNYTLQGAEFLVTGPNSFSQTVTTNAEGKVTLTSIPSGTYIVKETKAPNGFTLNSTAQNTTIAGDKKTVTIMNTPIRPVATIRHYDKDTNELLATSKHTHYYNDDYVYRPREDLKFQNKYKFYPLDNPKTGRITQDITLDFYYSKPSVDVGLQKIQIKTARSDKGLPVNLTFNLTKIKDDWLNKRIDLSIYDMTTNTRVLNRNVAISEIRNGLDLVIPASFLTKNDHRNYEARIESVNGNIYPFTSNQWNNRVFSGWQSYFDTIPIGSNAAIKVGDTISWSATIRPEQYTGGIMAHFVLPNDSYVQRHSSTITAGKEGKVTGTTVVPNGATGLRLALRHMAGTTPSQKFNFKELKLELGNNQTEYRSNALTEVVIPENAAKINTDGYTSTEETIEKVAKNGEYLTYTGIIMTERELNKPMKEFYETIDIPLNELKEIKSGYGFEMNQMVTYENSLGNTNITDQFEVVLDSSIVDGDLYTRSGNKTTIPLASIGTNGINMRNQVFEFPSVFVQEKTGKIITPSQANTIKARNGGKKVYVPIWIDDLGSYDYLFRNKVPIGVNEVNIVIHDQLDVIAYMYAHINSETLDKDEILIEPVNLKNPFPKGLPKGWKQSDVEWLQAN